MFDLVSLIRTVGYVGIFGIIFAECGIVIGFFLPGDSLLFTAGVLASQGYLNIGVLILCIFLGAVLGSTFGYGFGKKVGPGLFKREDSIFFHKDNVARAKQFYERHGGKALLITRFMPIVRTFVPVLAGVGRMRYSSFFFYNLLGGLLWALGLPLLGFYLGSTIPSVDRYLLPIVGLIIVLSAMPTVVHFWRDKEHRQYLITLLKTKLRNTKE